MNDLEVGNLDMLGWAWLVVLSGMYMLWGSWWSRRAERRFASHEMLARILPARRFWPRMLTRAASLVSLGLLVVCLMDVRWGEVQREVPQRGIEVMFVLDVSRSMLAEDVTPNRLARAKQMIRDTIDGMSGDRVGLVIFAGESRQRIPLTNHYDDFKRILDEVGPDDLNRGGSRLGDAISLAAEGFLSEGNAHRAMVVLTDGEDQESDPLKVAEQVHRDSGARIFTIGLGDIAQGARIPIERQGRRDYVQHEGEQVWSKLDGQLLTEIAQVSTGAYIPAGTKQVNMADVYHGFISSVEQTEFETARISRLEARFQWFLLPALLALIAEFVLAGRRETRVQQI
jgi:Ca-activated chloride channel family protein